MEAVLVAVVTAVGGVLAVLVQKSREENKEDHGQVMNKLIDLHSDVRKVEVKVDHVEESLTTHLLEHSKEKVKTKKK